MLLINVPLGWGTEVFPELCSPTLRIFATVTSILVFGSADAGEDCDDCNIFRMLIAEHMSVVAGIACAVGEGNPVPERLSPAVLSSPVDVSLSEEDAGDSDERPIPLRRR